MQEEQSSKTALCPVPFHGFANFLSGDNREGVFLGS